MKYIVKNERLNIYLSNNGKWIINFIPDELQMFDTEKEAWKAAGLFCTVIKIKT